MKKKIKGPKRNYSQDVIGLMEMVRDMGHTPVTRFGGIKATKAALKKIKESKSHGKSSTGTRQTDK